MNNSEEKTYWGLIWDKFRNGDRMAFEMIYNEYIDALFAYGYRISADRVLLEDSIQDVFLEIYKYSKRLRNPESLEFYLYKTLKRIIIRKLKEKYRFTHPDNLQEQFEIKFPLENLQSDEQEERIVILQQELKMLDVKKRELLFLKFNSGLTYNEIGILLHIKPDTVKKQVSRILKLLQKKINSDIVGLYALILKG